MSTRSTARFNLETGRFGFGDLRRRDALLARNYEFFLWRAKYEVGVNTPEGMRVMGRGDTWEDAFADAAATEAELADRAKEEKAS